MGLPELALKIIFCLLLAGLIGWIVGFFIGRIFGSANATELLNDCEGKMRVRDQEMSGLRSDLTAAHAKTVSLETELMTLATTLRTRENWVTELEAKNDELQADLNDKISELEGLKAASEKTKAALNSPMRKTIADATGAVAAQHFRVAEAEGSAPAVGREASELNTLRHAFEAKEEELAQALFRLENLESLPAEINSRDMLIASMEASYRSSLIAKETELADLQAHIGELKAQLGNSEALQGQSQERAGKVNSQPKDIDVEMAQMRLRLSELEPLVLEVQRREAKVRNLSSQLASQDSELVQLRNRLVDLEGLAGQLQQRDASLQEWETRYTTLARDKDAEMAGLKVYITELEMMAREVKAPVVKVSQASSLPPSTNERDDLKDIFGIGPVLEGLLNSHGIYWFRQIAEWTPEDVRHYDNLLADFRGRIERDDWITGARQAYQKKYGDQL